MSFSIQGQDGNWFSAVNNWTSDSSRAARYLTFSRLLEGIERGSFDPADCIIEMDEHENEIGRFLFSGLAQLFSRSIPG